MGSLTRFSLLIEKLTAVKINGEARSGNNGGAARGNTEQRGVGGNKGVPNTLIFIVGLVLYSERDKVIHHSAWVCLSAERPFACHRCNCHRFNTFERTGSAL